MTDVSESQLHRIIAGDSKAKIDTIVAIAKATDVNIEWLATGEGPMLPGDELAAPAGFDIDLMGQIMAIFMDAAYTQKTAIPAKDIGEMAARAYVDILADFPDPENRQKALRQLATIANNITRLYG
ncbi:hypothetical protein AL013_10365 [Mariprofundus ferrooxydans]|uniref:HTH cro/C1-type domain-containing protein n=2 Tax=Mariprofundus ferrooxydans TaxID=314344 RepID=Q0EWA5_9PROT|nr:hypothetical protein SPV1_02973 [Mariprofundus ferrooxydans PV-1]KON46991.1 hypothetical protein AL013_10365 [Mariprofundus ferrooxydans]